MTNILHSSTFRPAAHQTVYMKIYSDLEHLIPNAALRTVHHRSTLAPSWHDEHPAVIKFSPNCAPDGLKKQGEHSKQMLQ
jgi:hypothetical protein